MIPFEYYFFRSVDIENTQRIIGPSKLAILRTLPLLYRFIGGSKILRALVFLAFLVTSICTSDVCVFSALLDCPHDRRLFRQPPPPQKKQSNQIESWWGFSPEP